MTFETYNLVIWPRLDQKNKMGQNDVFQPKHGHMTKLWVSKVTFDLGIRFSVKKWPIKHICHNLKVHKNAFFGHFSLFVDFSRFLKKSIFAIFRSLHLRRVLSIWVENCVRALSCSKEFPYQFSAQTDSTRRRYGPRKNAILAFKGYYLWILSKSKNPLKRRFWALWDYFIVQNRFFSSFWTI